MRADTNCSRSRRLGCMRSRFEPTGVPVMSKGVDSKRRFLVENKIAKVPQIIKKALREYWTSKIAAMPEGDVLDEYYKVTRHD